MQNTNDILKNFDNQIILVPIDFHFSKKKKKKSTKESHTFSEWHEGEYMTIKFFCELSL